MILFGIGLLVNISVLSAQEFSQENEVPEQEAQTEQAAENPLRIYEQAYTFTYDENNEIPASGSSAWIIIRMLLVLALAAAAIYGVVYFLKKKSKGQSLSDDPFLKVLANAPLGNNRYAHIISVGSRAWLVASGDGGVNLISEIDDQDVLNSMLLEESKRTAEAASGRMPDFKTLLRRLGIQTDKKTPTADELRRHREKLRQM